MIYLLLILFPISMAASCFVLRKRTALVTAAAVGTVIVQMLLAAQIPIDDPSRLLGITLTLNSLTRLFMLLFLSVSGLAFIAAWHLPHGENFVPVALVTLSLICGILLLQDLFIIALLLVGAGLAAVLALVDLPPGAGTLVGTRSIATALKYLVLMVLAGVLMYLGFVLVDVFRPGELPGRIPLSRFVLALLALGFAFRLALIPFHTWLPDMVEDAAPMVSALVVAIINSASFLVLLAAFQAFPALLADNTFGLNVLRAGALLTVIVGALLALGQTSLRRTLAYLIIYNSGMVFYGLSSLTELGLMGAVFEALNQTLAITLIFVSLGLLERPDGRAPGVVRRDLLWRWPVAGVGLLGGGLALLGLPPFNGFASKLLIYEAAAQRGWLEPMLLFLATGVALLALMRLGRDWLFGSTEEVSTVDPLLLGETELDRPAVRRLAPEPLSTAALTLLLLLLCLSIGLYPQPVLDTIAEAVRGLAFVRAL